MRPISSSSPLIIVMVDGIPMGRKQYGMDESAAGGDKVSTLNQVRCKKGWGGSVQDDENDNTGNS